ncbi:hypothetical protein [Aureispira anguillae]|uniref:Uncharacterized protein n=1 Tax=Aureispira anguillae TaxID=2864201 RepID=A0A915YKU6_9BACT|nr:hypothetical protein [Aureispira anguillae]BDS15058.1 hypothetical protein AsAng_0058400 [Aureispira anguillae]
MSSSHHFPAKAYSILLKARIEGNTTATTAHFIEHKTNRKIRPISLLL